MAAQTYERSVVYPNGHRNVIMPRRGIRPLPRGELPGTRPKRARPTPSCSTPTCSTSAESAPRTPRPPTWAPTGATTTPRSSRWWRSTRGTATTTSNSAPPGRPPQATQIGGYQPKGFIWNALDKGYRLGFESTSDHVSTHLSYAIVFAEDATRPAIIDAFKQRHCYAATDNILLDVRSGGHLMGDAFTTREKPALDIVVKGTAPVAKVHVIRDNRYALHNRAQRARRDLPLSSTTTPDRARRITITSGSSRPTATSPGPRRCGSRTRNDQVKVSNEMRTLAVSIRLMNVSSLIGTAIAADQYGAHSVSESPVVLAMMVAPCRRDAFCRSVGCARRRTRIILAAYPETTPYLISHKDVAPSRQRNRYNAPRSGRFTIAFYAIYIY